MTGTLLFVVIFFASCGGILVAWMQWFSQGDHFRPPKWRNVLGLTALSAATLQILVLILFEAYAVMADDFSYRARNIFLWGRIATYLCILTLLAALIGKGRFRIAVALSALATEAIWFALGMGL